MTNSYRAGFTNQLKFAILGAAPTIHRIASRAACGDTDFTEHQQMLLKRASDTLVELVDDWRSQPNSAAQRYKRRMCKAVTEEERERIIAGYFKHPTWLR